MCDCISGGMMPMPPQQSRNSAPSLSSDQRQLITDTLNQFDVSNLTKADAQSIVSTFSEAGIEPGRGMAEAIFSAGFDAREIGEMAGVQGPPPHGGEKSAGGFNIDKESIEELFSLLDQYMGDDRSDEERSSAIKSLRNTLIPEDGLFSATA